MFSRRKFFSGATTVAVAGAMPALQAAAQGSANLPPAIAALPSFTGKVAPFTNDERLARIEKAKALMSKFNMGAIVLSNSTSSTDYFANVRLGASERMWAVVIPAKAKPFFLCPHFENDRAHEMLSTGPFGTDTDVLLWEEDENPFALLVKGLKDRGISTGKVGLDEQMKWVFANSIIKAGPQLNFVSATPVTAGCRMIKDEHELQCLRTASAATLAVYEAVYKSLKEGMTTVDVRTLVRQGYDKTGLVGEASLNIDEYTASPHGSRKPQTIREGSILMLDDGCVVEGYTSDITRTFVLGKPTDKMIKVFNIVHQAQQAALHAARPGVVMGDIDRAARKVIVDAGYGPGFTYFSHRVGHGMGLDMHEWNYLVENNMFGDDLHPVLQANMTTSDEPGIYIRGEFGVRIEDSLHITESGAELITTPSPSLEDPFGKA
jgi:Xaa-Pro dipeptidase